VKTLYCDYLQSYFPTHGELSTTHSGLNKRKVDFSMAKKVTKKNGTLNTMSIAELQAELQRREKGIRKLEKKRERLLEELAGIDVELASVGALSASGGVRRRPRNDMNLVDSLAKVLKSKTLSVTEATEAVQKAGYLTTAANFRTIVNQALIRETKVFKKVSRGQYTAK